MPKPTNPAGDRPALRPDRTDLEFTMPPLDAMTDRMLLPIDRVILALLAHHAGSRPVCWPTNRRLARLAGCSLSTVHRALRRLQQLEWITTEPCPSTGRGQLIRLGWTRRRRGVSRVTRGGVTGDTGGVSPLAPRTRTRGPEPKPEALSPQGDPDLIPEEDLPMWSDLANAGDRVMRNIARVCLKKHAEALARAQRTPPAGRTFGESPAGGGEETGSTVPDPCQFTKPNGDPSRSENPIEHNSY